MTRLRPRRRGIALILVLGLLAVLLVTGIALAVLASLDRDMARLHRGRAAASELTHSALARFLADLNTYYDEAGAGDADGALLYPEWNAWAGFGDGSPDRMEFARARLLTDAARTYIPGALLDAAHDVDEEMTWMLAGIDALPDGGVLRGTALGRYAYLAVNVGGLLDANRAGGLERGAGDLPEELVLRHLAELADVEAFLAARAEQLPYEDVPDLHAAQRDALATAPQVLFPYSHARPGVWDPEAGAAVAPEDRIRLDADLADWETPERETAFKAALTDLGATPEEADRAYLALLDFIDDDVVPRDPVHFGSEAVPRFNEVVATLRHEVTPAAEPGEPDEHRLTARIDVEWAFLHLPASTHRFVVRFAGTAFADPAPDGAEPQAFEVEVAGPAEPGYAVGAAEVETSWTSHEPPGEVAVGVRITEAEIRLEASDDLVDGVDGPFGFSLVVPAEGEVVAGYEAVDPRFNGSPSDPEQWVYAAADYAPSLGEANAAALARQAEPDADGDSDMHVGNRPFRAVADLGYLPFGPWRTIPVTGPEAWPVYRRFVARDPDLAPRRGLVNPNTDRPEVLQAAFLDLPLERYAEDPDAPAIDEAQSLALADAVIGAGLYRNLSELARVPDLTDGTHVPLTSSLQRHALMRHAEHLLTLRSNLFLVFLGGEVYDTPTPPPGEPARPVSLEAYGTRVATRRALALVWVDPFPRADDGGRDAFVRWFRWLDE